MKKRFLSLTLATAMALSIGTAALADTVTESDGVYQSEATGTGEVEVPTISIEAPTTLTVRLNPYQLEWADADDNKHTDALINIEQEISSSSNVPIAVSATTKAEPSDGVVMASNKLTGKETTKSVFSYLEVIKDGDSYGDSYSTSNASQVIFAANSKATTKKELVTLDAVADGGDPSKAKFKIIGDVCSTPAKAWTSTDNVKYTVTFNFEPKKIDVATP